MNKPECEILRNGTKQWFLNRKLHREDGPAVVYPNGAKEWYLNGRLHREDGPAVEYPDGDKEWWLNNKPIHPEILVDLWLEREVFCWWDEANNTLNFGEINEK
jgi:hypothetical protein